MGLLHDLFPEASCKITAAKLPDLKEQ